MEGCLGGKRLAEGRLEVHLLVCLHIGNGRSTDRDHRRKGIRNVGQEPPRPCTLRNKEKYFIDDDIWHPSSHTFDAEEMNRWVSICLFSSVFQPSGKPVPLAFALHKKLTACLTLNPWSKVV